ncbi:hypothetical protein HK105_202619 [Polyrhizophydium stewartii]|uniref:Uncharacterized protein n=1 Tax=Polyrhizophydium stewartii TaxID=2732419 RepID=A0ABR4NE60_9FUNG
MPNIRGFGCSLVRHNGVAIAEHTVAASTSVFGSIIHSRVAPDDAGPLPFMVRIDNQGLSPAFFERQGTGDIAHHGAPQATAAACNGEQQVPGRAAVGSRLCVVLVVDSSLMFAHTLRSPTVRFLVPGRRIKPYSVESMRIVGGQTPTNIRVELWHCRVRHAAEGLSLWTNATPFDAQRTFLADEPAAMQFASLECERLGQRPLLSFVFSAAPILVPSIVWPDINFLPRIDSSGVLSLRIRGVGG